MYTLFKRITNLSGAAGVVIHTCASGYTYRKARKLCSQKTLFIKFLRNFNFAKTEHAQSEIHVVEKFWWN